MRLEGDGMGRGGLPRWVKPQLCALVDEPPQGPEWLHEIKYDGYRMHARLDHGKTQLLTRTGLDWTHKYPPIALNGRLLDAGWGSPLTGICVNSTLSKVLRDHGASAQARATLDRQAERPERAVPSEPKRHGGENEL